jgi:hypothetical protein
MRKAMLVGLFLAALSAFSGINASAQTTVNINATAGAVTFTSSSVTFNASGTASSSDPGGTYNFTLTGGPVGLTAAGGGNYTPDSTTLNFTLTGTGGTVGTLTGTVTLVDLVQAGAGGTGRGVGINTDFATNVTITSATGTMTEFLNNTGTLNLTLRLAGVGAISSIATTETASITSGSLTPNPEPASMVLFGSGLLALGAAMRKKKAVTA